MDGCGRAAKRRDETQIKSTKLEEKVKNTKRNIVSQFCETTRNTFFTFAYFFQFRETIETRQNSDLFRTVLYFAKLKKIRNCQPNLWTFLITQGNCSQHHFSTAILCTTQVEN